MGSLWPLVWGGLGVMPVSLLQHFVVSIFGPILRMADAHWQSHNYRVHFPLQSQLGDFSRGSKTAELNRVIGFDETLIKNSLSSTKATDRSSAIREQLKRDIYFTEKDSCFF